MKYLDKKSEKVLKSIIELHKSKFINVDLPMINIATLGKYYPTGELMTIMMFLMEQGYIFMAPVPNTNPQIDAYYLKREGEQYFSDKRRSIAFSSFRWIEIIMSGIGGAFIAYFLTK